MTSSDRKHHKLLQTWSREYKKGFSAYFVLLLLKKGSTYGFELSRKLAAVSRELPFGESGIYQQLKKLENAGLVISEWRRSDLGPRRKYYFLTPLGNNVVAEFTHTTVLPIIKAVMQLVWLHFPAGAAGLPKTLHDSADPGKQPTSTGGAT